MQEIRFKKPNIKGLKKDGYFLADMHFHSRYSDGISKVSSIIKKAKKLGIGFAITDHNVVSGSIEASKAKDIFLIPGVEVTTSEGIHTLLYFYSANDLRFFYNKYICHKLLRNRFSFLSMDINELIDYSKEFNCVISAAHPYAIAWTGIAKTFHKDSVNTELLSKINAIEVINGTNLKKRNLLAAKLAKKIDKGITAGSDGHTLLEFGKVLTYAKGEQTIESFLNAILKKQNSVIGKERTLMYRAASQSVKIKMPTKSPIAYMKKGYSYIKERRNEMKKGISKFNSLTK